MSYIPTGFELDIRTNKYDAAMQSVIQSASKVDSAFDQAIDHADEFEKALNDIRGNVDVKIRTDVTDDSGIRAVTSLDEQTVNIKTNLSDDIALTTIANFPDETVGVKTDLLDDTALTTISGFPDETVGIKTDLVDSSGLDALKNLADVDVSVTPIVKDASQVQSVLQRRLGNVDIEVGAEVKASDLAAIRGDIEKIKNLAVIDFVVNFPGNLTTLIDTLQSLPGVGALADRQMAEVTLSARGGGQLNPDELALAREINENAFADTIQEAAIFINQLKGIGVEQGNLKEVAYGALEARDAFRAMGDDVGLLEVALAQNALVANGLVSSYGEAADLLAAGATEGLNQSGDLLDTVREYSDSFEALGLTGAQAFDILKAGMGAGFVNTDFIADTLREFNVRLGEAAADPESGPAKALASLGIKNPRETGEKWGSEYFQGVVDAIANAPIAQQGELATQLLGTQSEDYASAFLSLTNVEEVFSTIEGRAKTVSDTLNNTIGIAFQSLFATINNSAADLLSSETLDLPGKIDAIKQAAQTFVTEVQAGKGLGEAAAISLSISPSSIAQFESIVGNIAITLASAIASILDALNQGEAADALRESIRGAVEQQFVFDVKIGDPESVERAIRTAAARGMSGEEIGAGLQQALEETFASGDIKGGKELLNSLGDTLINNPDLIAQYGDLSRFLDLDKINKAAEEAAATALEQFNTAFSEGNLDVAASLADQLDRPDLLNNVLNQALNVDDFDVARKVAETLGDTEIMSLVNELETEYQTASEGIGTSTDTAAQDVEEMADRMGIGTDDVETSTRDMDIAVSTSLANNELAWATWSSNVSGEIDSVQTKIDALAESMAAVGITSADLSGENQPSDVEGARALGGDVSPGDYWVGEHGPEIATFDRSGSIINAATSRQLMNAISLLARVPMGGNATYTYNIALNQTNTAQTRAQADGIGFRTARQVRGYA